MSLDTPQMTEFLALARTVRTPEGAKKYGEGVGQQIQRKQETPQPTSGPSPAHMRSLYRSIQEAKKIGDASQVEKLTTKFRSEFAQFAKGRSLQEAIAWAEPGKQQD